MTSTVATPWSSSRAGCAARRSQPLAQVAAWAREARARAAERLRAPGRSRAWATAMLGLLGAWAGVGCAGRQAAVGEAPHDCAEMFTAVRGGGPETTPDGDGDATDTRPEDDVRSSHERARAEGGPVAATGATPTLAEWRVGRSRLAALRGLLRRMEPHTQQLSLKLREPYTGRVMEARGAVAIAPPSSLRMILLGPGGTTALDLWVKEDRFRFAVPALDLLRRGDVRTPRAATRGLPVDFLKWWLLRPAEGTLLRYGREGSIDHFLLRDGSAIVDLCAADSGALVARRTTWAPAERSARAGEAGGTGAPAERSARAGEAGGTGAPTDRAVRTDETAPADRAARAGEPGGHGARPTKQGAPPLQAVDSEIVFAPRPGCAEVRYTQASTGLDIAVRCEGEAGRAPNPRAFLDPDEPAPDDDDHASAGGS